jgi:hypothetical protein
MRRHTSLRSAGGRGRLVLRRQCHQPGRSRRRVGLPPHLHRRHTATRRIPGEDLGWIDADPHVLVHPDGRFVPDNDYWLNEGDGTTFAAEIRRHFRDHPRRLVTRATLGPQPEAAWGTTPTTVLIGERDNMLSQADRKWAEEHLKDVRVIDADHFIIFRRPHLVAKLVLEALGRTT